MNNTIKETQHTPTPWNHNNGACVFSGDDLVAGCMGHCEKEESIANAAFIVRAVNSHDKLLQTLKTVREFFIGQEIQGRFYDVPKGFGPDMGMMGYLNDAIAKAEGK